MSFAIVAVCIAGLPLRAAAAEATASPAELAAPFAQSNPGRLSLAAADVLWQADAAARAVEMGFYSVAEGLYRRALEQPGLEAAERERVELGLITALIAQGRVEEAVARLEGFSGPRENAWLVRRGATDFLRREFTTLEGRLEEVRVESLAPADAGWYDFLHAMQLEHAGEGARADAAFEEATNRSSSAAERAMFRLGQFQARLNRGDVSDAAAVNLRRLIDQYQGRPVGFQATLQYAVVLDQLGRKPEAQAILVRQRDALPPEEAELRDQTLLLLGLVAGANTGVGRDAFQRLLVGGSDRDWQRAALIRLATTSPAEGNGAGALPRLLTDLLARQPPHPLTEDLLYFRADLALRSRSFERAEEDANALLTRFPGSDLRRHALALLASSAWQRQRFRTAADKLTQMRAEPLPQDQRARLAVLLAECYYRAGMEAGTAEDFRNAAEAYGIAQAERPPGVAAGTLFFQRVLALIRSGNTGGAQALIDDPAARADVDVESWWQAEWNLERMLQLAGRKDDAFRRVDALAPAVGVPAELRLRFLWLAAQLTLETGRAADTGTRVAALRTFLDGAEGAAIAAPLREEVASNADLLAAQARLETGDTEGGIGAIEKVRTDHPHTGAAAYSFIIQARYLARENRLVDAQALLINLADTEPKSEYAPRALYEAALLAERRGQEEFFREASDILERLARDYPQENLLFAARLKQADLARRQNQFAAAELIYRRLENDYPNHPDRAVAELSLADAMLAQAGSDPSKVEGAISRLERLFELPTAPADLRAEAGCQLGIAWQAQNNTQRSSEVFWEVYTRFLGDAPRAAQLGARGRYWVARALLALGQIEERANRPEKARLSYEAVLSHGLPGASFARGRLERFKTEG